jgi:hypothetical protein
MMITGGVAKAGALPEKLAETAVKTGALRGLTKPEMVLEKIAGVAKPKKPKFTPEVAEPKRPLYTAPEAPKFKQDDIIEVAYQARQKPPLFRATPEEKARYLKGLIVDKLGTDPTITFYRGIREGGKPLQKPYRQPKGGEVGAFWTSDINIAKTYGDKLYKVDVKASELANSSLADFVGGTQKEFHLLSTLQRRATLIEPPVRQDIAELTAVMREQVKARKVTTGARKVEWGRRVKEAETTLEQVYDETGDIGLARAMSRQKLQGKTPLETEGLQSLINEETMIGYRTEIKNAKGFSFWEKDRADRALWQFFEDPKRLWQPSEIKLLEKLFPGISEWNAIKHGMSRTKWTVLMDIANIPRAVLASGEFSSLLRQGAIIGTRFPKLIPRDMRVQLETVFSPKNWDKWDDIIRSRPRFREFEAGEGYMAPRPGALRELSAGEEVFQSTIAERLPGLGSIIRASERAYTAGLNYLRYFAFENYYNPMAKSLGRELTEEEIKSLGRFVNALSGRGNLPEKMQGMAPTLNALMFSPKLVWSRGELFKIMLDPATPTVVRKEAVRTMVQFFSAGAGILSLAKLGGAEIERDPRSSDVYKIKIGNTRLDIWAGYVQWARFIAQMATNERKVTGTGKIQELNRMETIWRMMQSKSSPIAGLGIDLMKGTNYLGEPMFEGGTETALRETRNRTLFLFAQDIWDAIETEGLIGAAIASPGALGIGVVSYPPKSSIPGQPLTPGRKKKRRKSGVDWTTLGR